MQHRSEIFVALQRLLPQHWLSRKLARIAESRRVWLKTLLIKRAVAYFGINLSEAERPNTDDYVSFNDFFTRALKSESRPIDAESESIVSPVDGAISQIGAIVDDQLIQAKGMHYSVGQLLGNKHMAQSYMNGRFSTLYLSPKDYHRVHAPYDCVLVRTRYIPGSLFSVNAMTTEALPALFARNERLVCEFESAMGRFCLVFVGAMLVAGIQTVWNGREHPGAGSIREKEYHDSEFTFTKGSELGRFQFGSTVILLFSDKCRWLSQLNEGDSIQLGQRLGVDTSATIDTR